ncbi:MAG TPA: hypothetical protein ENK18_26385 [Deltaproteobacteria bacterium]|nr:hypothetical protein [Deltaproteobacteria bacterium]
MSQWLVTQGDNQFSVEGLDELEELARRGDLSAGDMIQPPGTSEWIYVSEVDELRSILDARGDVDVDISSYRGAAAGVALASVLALGLLTLVVIGGGAIFYLAQQLPRGDERLLGEGGLAFSEMILTEEGSGLWGEPDKNAAMAQALPKDSVLELVAKRGDWYRARSKSGQEGWLPEDHVIPMYQLGGEDVKEEYDPLYNPDRYVEVINARWMQLPSDDPRDDELSKVTNFEFMMKNTSIYPMTGLVIQATIKDAKGHELETVEIPIDGLLPAEGRTMVGTLKAEERRRPDPDAEPEEDLAMTTFSFKEMAKDDPDLQLRWVSGVEVEMQTEDDDFTNAEIDIIELRAVPDEEASQVVRREE